MATRRRTGELDELKARLGLSGGEASPGGEADEAAAPAQGATIGVSVDVLESALKAPAAEPPAAPAAPAPEPVVAAAPTAPVVPTPASPSPAPRPAPIAAPSAAAGRDFSKAKAPAEQPISTPDSGDDTHASFKDAFSTGMIVAAISLLVVGVGAGWAFSTLSSSHALVESRVNSATGVLSSVEQTASALTGLSGSVAAITAITGLNEEFEAALAKAYGTQSPMLDAGALSSARTLLAYDGKLARQLVSYAADTSALAALVSQHRVATERDRQDLTAASANRQTRYGIAFDFAKQQLAYQTFIANPAAGQFVPEKGIKVTFSDLVLKTEGTGDERKDEYTVSGPDGQTIPVAAYNLIIVDAAQFSAGTSNETATSRYIARATDIRKKLDEVVSQQAELRKNLEAAAQK